MLAWISTNLINIVLVLLLALIVGLLVRYLLRQRGQGCACGGSCPGCGSCASCSACAATNGGPDNAPDDKSAP